MAAGISFIFHPAIILDVAHNEDGIKQLTEQIELTDHHELHLVIGFVNDKEIDKILALLPKQAHYYFTQATIPRALDAGILAQEAIVHGLKGKAYSNVNTALADAKIKAGKSDLIIVCGRFSWWARWRFKISTRPIAAGRTGNR
ncbi:MAG: hypothetical protein WDO16_24720 [Bacteroidota bacterium]